MPEFVTVPASTEVGHLLRRDGRRDAPTVVTISVTGGGVTRSADLVVHPNLPTLTGFSVSPTSVPGGTPATGTVTLGSPAPAGGVAVSLSSTLPGSASVPATVTVPAGATSASFTVTTFPVGITTAQLTATLGETTLFAAARRHPCRIGDPDGALRSARPPSSGAAPRPAPSGSAPPRHRAEPS